MVVMFLGFGLATRFDTTGIDKNAIMYEHLNREKEREK